MLWFESDIDASEWLSSLTQDGWVIQARKATPKGIVWTLCLGATITRVGLSLDALLASA